MTAKGAAIGGKPLKDAYLGIGGVIGAPYCDLTLAMNSSGASARSHNAAMFKGLPDENFRLLDKTESGSWVVVPILSRKSGPSVIGCISADLQYADKNGDIGDAWNEESDLLAFRRYAMELAADIVEPLLRAYRLDPNEIPKVVTTRGTFTV